MNFSKALEELKHGRCITNIAWNGKGMYLALQIPDQNSKMGAPYIYLNMPDTHPDYPHIKVPWTPSQLDIMSEKWAIWNPTGA